MCCVAVSRSTNLLQVQGPSRHQINTGHVGKDPYWVPGSVLCNCLMCVSMSEGLGHSALSSKVRVLFPAIDFFSSTCCLTYNGYVVGSRKAVELDTDHLASIAISRKSGGPNTSVGLIPKWVLVAGFFQLSAEVGRREASFFHLCLSFCLEICIYSDSDSSCSFVSCENCRWLENRMFYAHFSTLSDSPLTFPQRIWGKSCFSSLSRVPNISAKEKYQFLWKSV